MSFKTSEIIEAKSVAEFSTQLPRVGHECLALFMGLSEDMVGTYAQVVLEKTLKDPDYLLTKDDIPPVAEELAKMVAVMNGYRARSKWKMTGRPRTFGVKHRASGAHVDTNYTSVGVEMPLYGSWLQFLGDSIVTLKPIETFDGHLIAGQVDKHVEETDDPDYELGVKFKSDILHNTARFRATGPYFGVWPIGMSAEKGVYTTLHQVEPLDEKPRISTTLILNYTDRDY